MEKEKALGVEAKKEDMKKEKAPTASGNMITTMSKQRGIQGGLSLNMEI